MPHKSKKIRKFRIEITPNISASHGSLDAKILKYEAALVRYEQIVTVQDLLEAQKQGLVFTQAGFRKFAGIGTDTLTQRLDHFEDRLKPTIERLKKVARRARSGALTTRRERKPDKTLSEEITGLKKQLALKEAFIAQLKRDYRDLLSDFERLQKRL